MSETIDEMLEALIATRDQMRNQRNALDGLINLAEAEIRGFEKARAFLQPPAGNGAEPPKQRRPRRDIRALVRQDEAQSDGLRRGSERTPEAIAARIGCSASQVRKALAAMEEMSGS